MKKVYALLVSFLFVTQAQAQWTAYGTNRIKNEPIQIDESYLRTVNGRYEIRVRWNFPTPQYATQKTQKRAYNSGVYYFEIDCNSMWSGMAAAEIYESRNWKQLLFSHRDKVVMAPAKKGSVGESVAVMGCALAVKSRMNN